MTEYTEGEWEVYRVTCHTTNWHIESSLGQANNGYKICEFFGPDAEKNANFLVSAPRNKHERDELLEALVWVVDHVDMFGGSFVEDSHSTFEKFRELITKVQL